MVSARQGFGADLAQDHALTDQALEGLLVSHHANVIQHLVPEPRIQQVQHCMLCAACAFTTCSLYVNQQRESPGETSENPSPNLTHAFWTSIAGQITKDCCAIQVVAAYQHKGQPAASISPLQGPQAALYSRAADI